MKNKTTWLLYIVIFPIIYLSGCGNYVGWPSDTDVTSTGTSGMLQSTMQQSDLQKSWHADGDRVYLFAKNQTVYQFNTEKNTLEKIAKVPFINEEPFNCVTDGANLYYAIPEYPADYTYQLSDHFPRKVYKKNIQTEQTQVLDNHEISSLWIDHGNLYIQQTPESAEKDCSVYMFHQNGTKQNVVTIMGYIPSSNVLMYEDSIIYCSRKNYNEDYMLYRFSDSAIEPILDEPLECNNLMIYQGYIYGVNRLYKNQIAYDQLFKIHLQTRTKQVLYETQTLDQVEQDSYFGYLIYQNHIYFSCGKGTYKMDLNGKQQTLLFDNSYNRMRFIYNDQLYVYQPKVYSYLVTPLDEYELFSVDLNTAEITNYHF